MVTPVEVELLVDCGCVLGEGPCWNASTGSLLWVDIESQRIYRLDREELHTIQLPSKVGAVVPRADGGLLAAVADGFELLDRAGERERLISVEAEYPCHRMNDGKVDRLGRFWAGTVHEDFLRDTGSLYRLDPDGSVERVLCNLGLSNGLDWSPNGELMYFIDSLTCRVDVFEVDQPAGQLRNRVPFVTLREADGLPDGLTVDAEGNVWVACWNGGAIRAWDETGVPFAEITLPVDRPTSCAFGGPDLDRLYITTAKGANPGLQAPAGGLFVVNPGSVGVRRAPFAG